jgi:hypothetical protein
MNKTGIGIYQGVTMTCNGVCRYELRFAGVLNDLEDLMFDIIDKIIKDDGDLENPDHHLQYLLTVVTETFAVHEKDIIIGE